LSFFDDEDEEPPTKVGSASTQQRPRPQPRRPQRAGSAAVDHHAMMVRRRIAAGVGVVLLIVIVLVVNGCLKRGKVQALENYNTSVNQIGQDSQTEVARPLFSALLGAAGKSALEVEGQVNPLRQKAEELAKQAAALSVPSDMTAAQRNLLLALDMREEGVAKVATSMREALGSQAQQASTNIAGAMEIFLASDVIYSQRVVPLIQETLASGGVTGQTTSASRFLPNLGWLEAKTVQARVAGQASTSSGGAVTPGTHGSALLGVSVGTNKLEPSPSINHVSGGTNPTFTVMVEDAGSNTETDVKVEVSVTAEDKTLTKSQVIDKTEPGSTYNVNIPVNGVALGPASRVTVYVEPVPGETNLENNKGTYLAIFSH
jgi:hypothetical protein